MTNIQSDEIHYQDKENTYQVQPLSYLAPLVKNKIVLALLILDNL